MVLLHFCLRGGDGTTSLLSERRGWYFFAVVLGKGMVLLHCCLGAGVRREEGDKQGEEQHGKLL